MNNDRKNNRNSVSKRGLAPTGITGRVRRKTSETSDTTVSEANAATDQLSPDPANAVCQSCGGDLLFVDENRFCPKCNTQNNREFAESLSKMVSLTPGDLPQFIDCPGASVYDEQTGDVIEGADFIELDNESYEVKLVERAVFPPGHHGKRMIKPEHFGKIRRCQSCQDYTVRLRRKEGVDFCVPSTKYPNRKKLKTIEFVTHIHR